MYLFSLAIDNKPSNDVILTLWDLTYLVVEENTQKITSLLHYIEVRSPTHILIMLSFVGVVETYLYENMTETSCISAIFTCSICDITPQQQNCMVMS